MEQVDGAVLGGSDGETTEETTDPGKNDPEDDENQEGSTNVVHDGLEMTLVLSTLHEGSSATDERSASRGSGKGISFSALATGSVENSVTDVLVNSERLSSDGRLITSNDGVTDVVLALIIIVISPLLLVLVGVVGVLVTKCLPVLKASRVLIVADKGTVGGDDLTFLDDDLKGQISSVFDRSHCH